MYRRCNEPVVGRSSPTKSLRQALGYWANELGAVGVIVIGSVTIVAPSSGRWSWRRPTAACQPLAEHVERQRHHASRNRPAENRPAFRVVIRADERLIPPEPSRFPVPQVDRSVRIAGHCIRRAVRDGQIKATGESAVMQHRRANRHTAPRET